jgi:sugar/nucleoside kinase (ribokinase family)
MGQKILAASGASSNYELVVKQRKLGGNGPIMANALAHIGLGVTYVGSLGFPDIHPVFQEFASKARVISVADAGETDALEFSDGKLMFGKYGSLGDVNWENLLARVGRADLDAMLDEASLIGMVNWTMLPGMNEIWERLLNDIFPAIGRHKGTLFIDLADPEKRTAADLLDALRRVARFQTHIDVILGLNLKESAQVATVLGLPIPAEPEEGVAELAASIRQALGLACAVIHPRRCAAAATATEVAYFAGPFIRQPKISTGAGDHFNAGFCVARMLGLGLEESLCAGVSTSGYYVRSAESPSIADLADFAEHLPPPEVEIEA